MKKIVIFVMLLALLQSASFLSAIEYKAVLQAKIHAISDRSHELKTTKIQPGSTIKFEAEIKNVGNLPSAAGNAFIRFAMTEPLEDLLESRIFQTEPLPLPSIMPGQVVVLKFTKEHQWPTLHDFIRQNWNMRHYQAIVQVGQEKQEKVIGYLPIFFSAYYYEGPQQVAPAEVPSKRG